MKNLSTVNRIRLNELNGILLCEERLSQNCQVKAEIEVEPNNSVWLKIPNGITHALTIESLNKEIELKIREFDESRWHLVTV
ncbi:hypothetical protein QWZ13_11810 [Reinekea marina]|uniref:Uncharacterized protein n=1 Tax=Reinekea marina TaxID=1310421 RepID=A0ABV7WW80_9GAMM|nr:hypothetical protein [Reinekea marina]MDN3649602.1 hypothetical protein [Reinekea marina]